MPERKAALRLVVTRAQPQLVITLGNRAVVGKQRDVRQFVSVECGHVYATTA